MSSAPAQTSRPAAPFGAASASAGDRTARARIRDAAITLFGNLGYRATTVRAIAARADVSPALVLHHFGSKHGLREAVDEHVVDLVREGKMAAMSGMFTPSGDEYGDLARASVPVMAYLARSLAEGSDVGQHLYERLHEDAVGYLSAGVQAGVLVPCDDERVRAAVLLNFSLSTLLLGSHMEQVLGIDGADVVAQRIAPVVLDVYTDGIFADDRFRAAFGSEGDHAARTADADPPDPPDPLPGDIPG